MEHKWSAGPKPLGNPAQQTPLGLRARDSPPHLGSALWVRRQERQQWKCLCLEFTRRVWGALLWFSLGYHPGIPNVCL